MSKYPQSAVPYEHLFRRTGAADAIARFRADDKPASLRRRYSTVLRSTRRRPSDDILIPLCRNRGPGAGEIHLLPTILSQYLVMGGDFAHGILYPLPMTRLLWRSRSMASAVGVRRAPELLFTANEPNSSACTALRRPAFADGSKRLT